MYHNWLSGEIPPELGNLSNLWELYLDDNDLSGEVPRELTNLTRLEVMYISGNRLTGCYSADMDWGRDYNDFAYSGLTECAPSRWRDRAALTALYKSANGDDLEER